MILALGGGVKANQSSPLVGLVRGCWANGNSYPTPGPGWASCCSVSLSWAPVIISFPRITLSPCHSSGRFPWFVLTFPNYHHTWIRQSKPFGNVSWICFLKYLSGGHEQGQPPRESFYISPGQGRLIFCHLQLYSNVILLTLTSDPASYFCHFPHSHFFL